MTLSSQASYLGRLAKCLSHSRLQPFNHDIFEAVAGYTWNVALCEAFYPLIHVLEVALRNSLFDAIEASRPTTSYVDIPCWLDASTPILEAKYGQTTVAKAKAKLAQKALAIAKGGVAPKIQPGQLVAELEFGFWTSILGKYYLYQSAKDPRFWPHLLPKVFPHLPPKTKLHPDVTTRFNEIRHFRNRIFHHEPIWQRKSLNQDRLDILEAIGWISPEASRFVSRLDRVQEILKDTTRRSIRVVSHRITAGKP